MDYDKMFSDMSDEDVLFSVGFLRELRDFGYGVDHMLFYTRKELDIRAENGLDLKGYEDEYTEYTR